MLRHNPGIPLPFPAARNVLDRSLGPSTGINDTVMVYEIVSG